MKQLILALISLIYLFGSIAAFAQNQADSLYVKGVEAYNTKDYDKAIELFSKCDELNQSSNRQMPYYSSNASAYIAYIFFLQGDTIKAKETSLEYPVEPVDQRKTIKSDSISFLAIEASEKEDWEKAKDLFMHCAELEEQELGPNHYYIANTLYGTALLVEEPRNISEKKKLLEKALSIYKTTYNYYLTYDTFRLYYLTLEDSEDYDHGVDFCEDFINNLAII